MTVFQIPFHQNQTVGEQSFTTKGLTTFTVPADVYFISAVCIGGGGSGAKGADKAGQPGGGGGGLRWVNSLPVTPGETLNVFVGYGGTGPIVRSTAGVAGTWSYIARGATILISGNGGAGSPLWTTGTQTGGAGGTGTFDVSVAGVSGIGTGGGNGGAGGNTTGAADAGGGGAGGYSGNGGAGVNNGGTWASGANGGTGGGGAGGEDGGAAGIGGGGVGISGEGTSGGSSGAGGSGGTTVSAGTGGVYGGGGGGADAGNDTAAAGSGGNGAVRIIWGKNRSFPTTNVDKKVTFVGFSTSSADTITIPATAQEGDVAFLFDGATAATTAPTNVVPTNWTSVATASVNAAVALTVTSSYKILSATDAGTSITGINGTVNRKVLVVFRPNFTATSLTLSTPGNSATTANPASQTISLTSATTPVIGLAQFRADNAITTRSVTGGTMTEIENTTLHYIEYVIDNNVDTLTNTTVDINDFGTNGVQSFYATINGYPYG